MSFWSRLLGGGGDQKAKRISWKRGPCWKLSRPDGPPDFYRALPVLFPTGCALYLEDGKRAPEVARFLEERATADPRFITGGTLLPRPKFYCLPIDTRTMDELGSFAQGWAFPDVAVHVHVYSGDDVLLIWYDACCGDSIYVSKAVPEERLRAFCTQLGMTYEGVDDF